MRVSPSSLSMRVSPLSLSMRVSPLSLSMRVSPLSPRACRGAAVTLSAIALAYATTLTAWAGDASNAPVYPGAKAAAAVPSGIAPKTPPPSTKAYTSSDSFATVKAWYKSKLKDAMEASQPGQEAYEDAFLVGSPGSGYVVMVKTYQGKTWILIGPPQ